MARLPSEETQQRKAEIVRLRRQGVEFAEIGERFGVSKQRAHQIYTQALKEIPAHEVTELRTEQAERLDDMLRRAYEVLGRRHLTVSGGSVVIDDRTGTPVYDDGPTLAAIKTVLLIEDQRAKLYGTYAPVKQQVGGDVTVTYTFEGVDLDALS
ncbi:sigma factor-like helix-turn-helix DNA-binding protein [Nonomuraea angiospora]